MICNECFFYDLGSKACAERHNLPAEEEKCYFFEPQVEVSLNQVEIWAILDTFMFEKDSTDPALTSLDKKFRKVLAPQTNVHKLKPQDHMTYEHIV